MTRHSLRNNTLIVIGIALLVAPALFPIQPVLYHDSNQQTMGNETQIEQRGYEIIAYENLSTRGQQLYVQTLRNEGEYYVPLTDGASEFPYPTNGELGDVEDYEAREALQTVVIERPPNADLPPADEPLEAAELRYEHNEKEREQENSKPEMSVAERRQQIARFDVMTTKTDQPPLDTSQSLLRLLSVVGGVFCFGIGGYLRSKPSPYPKR